MSVEYRIFLTQLRDAVARDALKEMIQLIPHTTPPLAPDEIVNDAWTFAELFVAERERRYGPPPAEMHDAPEKKQ